jgi:hypothetical protein
MVPAEVTQYSAQLPLLEVEQEVPETAQGHREDLVEVEVEDIVLPVDQEIRQVPVHHKVIMAVRQLATHHIMVVAEAVHQAQEVLVLRLAVTEELVPQVQLAEHLRTILVVAEAGHQAAPQEPVVLVEAETVEVELAGAQVQPILAEAEVEVGAELVAPEGLAS